MEMKRIGLRVNVALYDRVSKLADRYGLSMSNLCAFIIGQYMDTNEVVKTYIKGMVSEGIKESNDKSVKLL